MSRKFWSHPRALVESATVGRNTRVWAFAHIMPGAVVGADCNIGEQVFIETGAVVGDRVTLKNGVQVWDGIRLADDVFVGPNAVFTNDRYPRSPRSPAAGDKYRTKKWLEATRVGRGATIGANATIMCGLEIGAYAMIGAGAVVTRSVPDYALALGAPGVIKGYVCACGKPLTLARGAGKCRECGRGYAHSRGVVRQK